MIVIFYPQRCVPEMSSQAVCMFDAVRLVAGANDLTDEQWASLQSHPDFARYAALEAIAPKTDTDTDTDPNLNSELADLKSYKVTDAQEIVSNTSRLDLLELWLTAETRTQVRTALNIRIEQIKTGIVA